MSGFRTLGRSQSFRALLGTFVLQALATGTMLAGAQYVATWVLRSEDAVTFVFGALVGPALLATPGWTMLPDVISHDERTSGPGQAGTFTGIWTAGETVGFALGATAVSLTLAATGYISTVAGTTVEQPEAAITGIVLSFSILPAVLMGASLLTLRRYRLRRADIDAVADSDA